jgi:hypothetical protein
MTRNVPLPASDSRRVFVLWIIGHPEFIGLDWQGGGNLG